MNKAEIIASCIDGVREGRSTIDDCLTRYPDISAELKPILETAMRVRPGETSLSRSSRARIRAGLVAAMAHDRETTRRTTSMWTRSGVFTRVAASSAAVVLAVGVLGGGSVLASQSSLPGDFLYPVKTGSENAQLDLTFSPTGKAGLRLKLARRRLDEQASLVSKGTPMEPTNVSAVASQLDKALEEIAMAKPEQIRKFMQSMSDATLQEQLSFDSVAAKPGVGNAHEVQATIDILKRGKLIADVSYSTPAFLKSKPSVTDSSIEDGEFAISGVVTEANKDWHIDGLTLNSVNYSGSVPAAESKIKVRGINHGGQIYVTGIQADDNSGSEASIEGTFKGTDGQGSTWNVAGISVEVAKDVPTPSKGDELKLRRGSDSKAFSQVEKKPEEQSSVSLSGTLSGVEINKKSIQVTSSGVRSLIDVSSALLTTSDGRPVTLSQLQSSIGQEIDIGGLRRQGQTLSASKVTVHPSEHR